MSSIVLRKLRLRQKNGFLRKKQVADVLPGKKSSTEEISYIKVSRDHGILFDIMRLRQNWPKGESQDFSIMHIFLCSICFADIPHWLLF